MALEPRVVAAGFFHTAVTAALTARYRRMPGATTLAVTNVAAVSGGIVGGRAWVPMAGFATAAGTALGRIVAGLTGRRGVADSLVGAVDLGDEIVVTGYALAVPSAMLGAAVGVGSNWVVRRLAQAIL